MTTCIKTCHFNNYGALSNWMLLIIVTFCILRKEVEKCKSKKMKYDFAYYILICKTYRQKGQKDSPLFYTNAEEEFLKEVMPKYNFENEQ